MTNDKCDNQSPVEVTDNIAQKLDKLEHKKDGITT